MPRDACDVLRNFDELVAQAMVSRDDLGDLIQECIGEESEDKHSWVPLCPEYPNLKGVTCPEIEEFIDKHSPDISHDVKWRMNIDQFQRRFDEAYRDMRKESEDYNAEDHVGRDPEIHFWYDRDGEGAKITRDIMDFLMTTLPDKEKAIFEEDVQKEPTAMIAWARALSKYYDRDRGWQTLDSRDMVRDYLHNVKVYDRDEEFKAFQRTGDELAKRIWNNMNSIERDKVYGMIDILATLRDVKSTSLDRQHYGFVEVPNSRAYGSTKRSVKDWDELMEMEEMSDVIKPGRTNKDILKAGILGQRGTIYVTTPRGGHEMLSIFSYANNIGKESIPSRIVFDMKKISGLERMIGMEQQKLLEMDVGDKDREWRSKYDQITADDIADLNYIGYTVENFEDYKEYWIKTTEKTIEMLKDRLMNEPKDLHRGKTWLGDSGGPIKRVVVVDDIVASGLQMDQAYNEIKGEFPNADIFSVHLCHRKEPDSKDNPLVNFGKAIYDVSTSGIVDWKEHYGFKDAAEKFLSFDKAIDGYYALSDDEKGRLAEELFGGNRYINETRLQLMTEFLQESLTPIPITCLYPHACPDGRSDRIIARLMGSGRCSPEKRIRERDM